jgi:hypothetical protein
VLRDARGTDQEDATKEAVRQNNRDQADVLRHNALTTLARCVTAPQAKRLYSTTSNVRRSRGRCAVGARVVMKS